MKIDDDRTAELRRLVHLIISSIADDVRSIVVEAVEASGIHTRLEVHLHESDRGKVIGREGRVAAAIRQFVRAYQLQHGGSYSVSILGADQGAFSPARTDVGFCEIGAKVTNGGCDSERLSSNNGVRESATMRGAQHDQASRC